MLRSCSFHQIMLQRRNLFLEQSSAGDQAIDEYLSSRLRFIVRNSIPCETTWAVLLKMHMRCGSSRFSRTWIYGQTHIERTRRPNVRLEVLWQRSPWAFLTRLSHRIKEVSMPRAVFFYDEALVECNALKKDDSLISKVLSKIFVLLNVT